MVLKKVKTFVLKIQPVKGWRRYITKNSIFLYIHRLSQVAFVLVMFKVCGYLLT